MIRVRQANGALLAIAAFMMLLCIPSASDAAGGRTYRVHGQVTAVNVSQSPHMIVVKTPLSTHNDMTVGAKVSPNKNYAKGEANLASACQCG